MAVLRAVLFDYGHTLVDFRAAEEKLLTCYEEVRRMLEAEALHEVPAASRLVESISRRVVTLINESYERGELEELDIVDLYESAWQAAGVHVPRELMRQIAEMEHRALFSGLHAPAENLEVLRALRAAGLKVGLVSNATLLPELMHEDIERLGIAQHVDAAVFSAEVGVRKPHPAIFRRVLAAVEAAPSEAVFVGDRLHDDVGGARALGMRAVLTRQYRSEEPEGATVRPDYVVDRLPDIVPYLRGLMASSLTSHEQPPAR